MPGLFKNYIITAYWYRKPLRGNVYFLRTYHVSLILTMNNMLYMEYTPISTCMSKSGLSIWYKLVPVEKVTQRISAKPPTVIHIQWRRFWFTPPYWRSLLVWGRVMKTETLINVVMPDMAMVIRRSLLIT